MTTHISADVQRITLNASCITISGERTKQLDIFCRVTGLTSDILSFIDVELIRFLHGALQLLFRLVNVGTAKSRPGRVAVQAFMRLQLDNQGQYSEIFARETRANHETEGLSHLLPLVTQTLRY